MLEFCENVTPNLQGYDPDAVSLSYLFLKAYN